MKSVKLPRILHVLLSIQRPHGGEGEAVAQQVLWDVLKDAGHPFVVDSFGNTRCTVGDSPGGRWFTSHLDTVHRTEGRQTPVLIADSNSLVADDVNGLPCVLGADDAAGVYLMTEMIQAGVPGNYMFFLGEECGGLGSSHFIQENGTLSADFCVSFDRRGTTDVITHQGGWRTASDDFANALASELNKHGFKYRPSDAGLYTDSKEFAELVPECTNISVGYYHEHTSREELDLGHLLKLRDAVLAIDWASLPIKRVPDKEDWGYPSALYGNDIPYSSGYTALGTRVSGCLMKHYDTLPDDVFNLLTELEEMLND